MFTNLFDLSEGKTLHTKNQTRTRMIMMMKMMITNLRFLHKRNQFPDRCQLNDRYRHRERCKSNQDQPAMRGQLLHRFKKLRSRQKVKSRKKMKRNHHHPRSQRFDDKYVSIYIFKHVLYFRDYVG